ELNINQQFSVYGDINDKTSDYILVLYQQYRSSPGNIIVNNVEEQHQCYQSNNENSNVLGKPLEKVEHGHVEHFSPNTESTPTSTIQGSLISVWSFDRSVDHVVLGTTVKHGMSDSGSWK
ncbi:hypothetical protein ACTFIT_003222, partial [Dictyostelium discoideum]